MRTLWAKYGLALLVSITGTTYAEETGDDEIVSPTQEDQLSRFSDFLHQSLNRRAQVEGSGINFLSPPNDGNPAGPDVVITPGGGTGYDDGFGGDPRDNPNPYPYPDVDTTGLDLPFITRKSGAAELLALEALYQTLMYYGVVHIVEKKGTRRDFKIIESRSGYFKDLTSLDIAFAIRAFSLYVVAMLCNDPSQANFAKMLSQVKPEEIGLRFKYDMAWALLGNYLPREPNEVMKLGTKWKALNQVLGSTRSLGTYNKEQVGTLKTWATSIGDVVNILSRLNKLMCYVDIRPDPREEIKKRMVTRGLLDMKKRLDERYADLKDLVDAVAKEGKKEQLDTLKKAPSENP